MLLEVQDVYSRDGLEFRMRIVSIKWPVSYNLRGMNEHIDFITVCRLAGHHSCEDQSCK